MGIDLTRISMIHVALIGLTAGLAVLTRWIEPTSLLLGGAVMGANFVLLRWITNVLRATASEPGATWRVAMAVMAMTLKFVLFLGLLAALFWRLPIEGMSFALGVTLLLVACLVEVARYELWTVKGAS